MKNFSQFWRANHDIQPVIDLYAMTKYILSYVTKIQKGKTVIMEQASKRGKGWRHGIEGIC